MIDIISVGTDLGLFDTNTSKAKNILAVQVGNLEYAPTVGIDLAYFLSENFEFQNSSFKSYLIQVLAIFGISSSAVVEETFSLYTKFTFNLDNTDKSAGLVAR